MIEHTPRKIWFITHDGEFEEKEGIIYQDEGPDGYAMSFSFCNHSFGCIPGLEFGRNVFHTKEQARNFQLKITAEQMRRMQRLHQLADES